MVLTHAAAPPLPPPPKVLWAAEVPRALWSVATAWRHRAALAAAPRGDARPVLVLPGLFNADRSNIVMRAYLRRLDYRTYRWELGRNLGARAVGGEAERLIARVAEIAADTGIPVTLIGVSLGGVMARLVAHRRPDLVRAVVTVSAPYAGPASATNVWRFFEWLTGERIGDAAVIARQAEIARPLPVPATAIWSRSDGLVNGMICHGPDCRAIEVASSHLFVQMNPPVLLAIATALADQSLSSEA